MSRFSLLFIHFLLFSRHFWLILSCFLLLFLVPLISSFIFSSGHNYLFICFIRFSIFFLWAFWYCLCLSVSVLVFLSVCLSVCLSIGLSVCLCVCLPTVCPSIRPSIYLFGRRPWRWCSPVEHRGILLVRLSIGLSIVLPIHPSVSLSICVSPYICMSVCLSVCPSRIPRALSPLRPILTQSKMV